MATKGLWEKLMEIETLKQKYKLSSFEEFSLQLTAIIEEKKLTYKKAKEALILAKTTTSTG